MKLVFELRNRVFNCASLLALFQGSRASFVTADDKSHHLETSRST